MSYTEDRIAQIRKERGGAYALENHGAWLKKYPQSRIAKSRAAQGLPTPTRPEPIRCECCGKKRGQRALSLDHCHASGHFRGFLCDSCNRGIGMLGDTTEALEAALLYLRAAECDVQAVECKDTPVQNSQN